MISAKDRGIMQRAVGGLRQTPCTINRAGAPLDPQPTNPDGTALLCRVRADSRQRSVEGADPVEQQRRWAILLPVDLDLQADDHLLALGNTYLLIETANPTQNNLETTVYAYMLFDTHGTAVYLRPNVLVSSTRKGVAKLVDVGAERYEPEVVYTPDGEVVNTKYKLPYPVDVIPGDSITEAGKTTGIVRLVSEFPTGMVSTDLLVTRSLT